MSAWAQIVLTCSPSWRLVPPSFVTDRPRGIPGYVAAGTPEHSGSPRVIRWMETIVQRNSGKHTPPTIERPWRVLQDPPQSRTQKFIRLLNVAVALVALILLSP